MRRHGDLNMSNAADLAQLKAQIQKHFTSLRDEAFHEGKSPMPLSIPTYGWEET